MSQTQQYKKVKLYRTLKVVFYMLGLPLFLTAVCFTAVRFISHDPFMGESTFTSALGFFKQAESYITAPALYGVWIGFAVWAFISIVHIILSKTVKNTRVRMFSVIAVCMATMLITGVIMDAVLEKKVTELQTQYEGTGVVVNDYKTQLSYYRTVSSNAVKKNDTLNLIAQVDLMKNVYNVEMEGENKTGVAGNISNKPVTYYSIIDDEGNQGVDISFVKGDDNLYRLDVDENNNFKGNGDLKKILDGTYRVNRDSENSYDYRKSPEYTQIVRLKPNANGQLVINGKTYSHYWYQKRITKAGEEIYVWYCKDLMPLGTEYANDSSQTNTTDGVYGTGIYNSNGMLSDGWVFSLDNVLNILQDYYSAQEEITANKYDSKFESMYTKAVRARERYYTGVLEDPTTGEKCPEWLQTLYGQEIEFAENFSLTHNGLDYLIAKVGALLGNNHLFDFLLKAENGSTGLDDVIGKFGVGAILSPILEDLQEGMSFKKDFKMDDATMTTVMEWIRPLLGVDSSVVVNDLFLVVAYAGAPDVFNPGETRDYLYVALVKDDGTQDADGNYVMGLNSAKVADGGDVLVDLNFSDAFVKVGEDGNIEYDFDLDHLSTFLNTALNGLMSKLGVDLSSVLGGGVVGTINGLLNLIKTFNTDDGVRYGLEISGIKIPLLDEDYHFAIDVSSILTGILEGLYYYQSPAIKPVWEFYTWVASEKDMAMALTYQKYERANYEATAFGPMIGSTLIGDTLGAGTYPSALGLANLTAVRQLKADLSYKPTFYPLYGVRDMLFFFCGVVVLFYFLSFVAQEKELEYANGTAIVEDKKKKKSKKQQSDEQSDEQSEQSEQDVVLQDQTPEQGAEGDIKIPADENSDKEAL